MATTGSNNERDNDMSTADSLASITEGIDSLESFLDELTQTLMAQNQEVEEMNQERQRYLDSLSNNFTPHDSAPAHRNPRHLPPTPPPRARFNSEQNDFHHSRLQMGHENRPIQNNFNYERAGHSQTSNNQETDAVHEDLFRRRLDGFCHRHDYNHSEHEAGRQLDFAVQFESTRLAVATGSNNTQNMGNDMRGTSNNSMMLIVIKRAMEAAAAAGDNIGHSHLEQLQRDLSNSPQSGVGDMQSQVPAQTDGGAEHTEALTFDLSGSDESDEVNDESDEVNDESDEPNDESSTSDFEFELHRWDQETTLRNFTQNFLISESEDSENDETILFGSTNFLQLYNVPPTPDENDENNVQVEEREIQSPDDSRRLPNRSTSPDTLHFYQSIGIRINEGDSDELKNGFRNSFIMSCPQTLYPPEELLGPDTPQPLLTATEANLCAEFNDILTYDTSDEENESKLNQFTHFEPELALFTPSKANLTPIELDSEDLELERLIQEFRRKKMEARVIANEEDVQVEGKDETINILCDFNGISDKQNTPSCTGDMSSPSQADNNATSTS